MRFKGQAGFTLVEVALVIVILAVLSAAIVMTGDLGGNRAASLSYKFAADLRYAQQLANASRIRHGVEVTSATAYRVFRDDGGAGTTVINPMTGAPFVVTMTGDFRGVTLATSLGGTPPKAQFDSIGRPFDGTNAPITAGSNTVDLIAGGVVIETVSVASNTGMVRVN